MTIESFKDVERASLQEIFDQVSQGLLRQGRKSLVDGECEYWGEGNCRCSFGFLMSPEEAAFYAGKGPYCILGWENLSPEKQLLLGCLMDCHDDYKVSEWKKALETIAEQFELEFSA